MPYITQETRKDLDCHVNALSDAIEQTSRSDLHAFIGILNYTISTLVCQVLNKKFGKLRYWHSPVIRGVLADVADEFYRRVMTPYEDKQILNNGDLPEYDELKR